ncbi:hypothetical protein KBC77_00715 [Candidatus Saccharibacteria bacterium]|nr:hypothetical protein [Candidatus Saccharibacteria bacterium]
MTCKQCNQLVDTGALFCGNCGEKVEGLVAPVANGAPQHEPATTTSPTAVPEASSVAAPSMATSVTTPENSGLVVESEITQTTTNVGQTSTPEPVLAPRTPNTSPYTAPATSKTTNGLAVAALVLSILGFLTGIFLIGVILDIIAIVLGTLALKKQNGHGLAIGGICVAAIGLFLTLLILPAFLKGVRERVRESEQNSYRVTNSIRIAT